MTAPRRRTRRSSEGEAVDAAYNGSPLDDEPLDVDPRGSRGTSVEPKPQRPGIPIGDGRHRAFVADLYADTRGSDHDRNAPRA